MVRSIEPQLRTTGSRFRSNSCGLELVQFCSESIKFPPFVDCFDLPIWESFYATSSACNCARNGSNSISIPTTINGCHDRFLSTISSEGIAKCSLKRMNHIAGVSERFDRFSVCYWIKCINEFIMGLRSDAT